VRINEKVRKNEDNWQLLIYVYFAVVCVIFIVVIVELMIQIGKKSSTPTRRVLRKSLSQKRRLRRMRRKVTNKYSTALIIIIIIIILRITLMECIINLSIHFTYQHPLILFSEPEKKPRKARGRSLTPEPTSSGAKRAKRTRAKSASPVATSRQRKSSKDTEKERPTTRSGGPGGSDKRTTTVKEVKNFAPAGETL
jgi:hypothetical protein